MNDTVTKLLLMVDELTLLAERVIDERGSGDIRLAAINDRNKQRQALQDELTRLFTPLTDEQIGSIYRKFGGDMINCARSIERQHGITGESNET